MAFKFGNMEIFPPSFQFDFMKWRRITISISVILVLISLAIIAVKGVNYSIDFLGGSEVNLEVLKPSINRDEVVRVAHAAGLGEVEVTTSSTVGTATKSNNYMLRLQRQKGQDETATSNRAYELVNAFKKEMGEENVRVGSITSISGKIGKEEEYKGYMALLLSCLGILVYISARFDSRFAPGAVLCLIHDVIIALGFMTLIDKPFTTASIAAFLTIVGYSTNDTVIVYDRIRETQYLFPRMPVTEVINKSISQTMNRTVLTSGTGLAALLVLAFLGGGAIEDFALTMFIGILVGTYSSIYVAAPLTLVMDDFLQKRGWKPKDRAQLAKVVKDPNYIPPVVLKKRVTKEG